MQIIIAASGESLLSYEEAVAVYLRARGILRDRADIMAAPIPSNWQPPQGGGDHDAIPRKGEG